MQNYQSCCVPITYEEYQKIFQFSTSLNYLRKSKATQYLSVYQSTKKPDVKNTTNQSSKGPKKFQNSIIKLTAGNTNILAFTRKPLEKVYSQIGGETYCDQYQVQTASYMLVDNYYLPSVLKTAVFSEMVEVKEVQIEVQTIELDESLSLSAYRLDTEEEQRILHQKKLNTGEKLQKHIGLKNITSLSCYEDGINQKIERWVQTEGQSRYLRNILLKITNKNLCLQRIQEPLLRIQTSKTQKFHFHIDRVIEKVFKKPFELTLDILRGNKDYKKQRNSREIKEEGFEMLIIPYIKTLMMMKENNQEYAYKNKEVSFWVVNTAHLINFALRPSQSRK